MFKKAVDTHEASAVAKERPLAQQLFPSSDAASPQSQARGSKLHFQRTATRPLSTATGNVQKQNESPLSGSSIAPIKSNSGLKRTSSGLAKALSSTDPFESSKLFPLLNSQDNPILIDERSPTRSKPFHSNGIYIDENDFDSDLDLDVEDPAARGSTAHPNLATAAHPSKFGESVRYPSLPVAKDHQTQGLEFEYERENLNLRRPTYEQAAPLPQSNLPFPWSSSPAEHQKTPRKPLVAKDDKDVPHGVQVYEEVVETRRQTKRRVLPWSDERQDNRREGISSTRANSRLSKEEQSGTQRAAYLWNTTASAIKDQQKSLRQANKRASLANENADEGQNIAKRRKSQVPQIFLSDEQKQVVDLVLEHKKSVFFTGSAGTGKSVLLREIIASLRKKHIREPDRVAVTASTGLAACNVGGVTLHSFSGIGLGKETVPELIKKIKRNQKAKHRWMRTKVLIVDEVSMVDGDLFDKLENIARSIRSNGRPFGGIQLVITGDFFQLPPVPDYGKVAKFAFDAGTWNTSIDFTIGLHKVFRQRDPVFAGMLNEMREGRMSQESIDLFRSLERRPSFQDEILPTELFPTRAEVDAANDQRMSSLQGDLEIFEARDGGSITDKVQRDKLLQNCMASGIIHLKKGAQVMLIKNIDESLVNGSLGTVEAFMTEDEMLQGVEFARENENGGSDKRFKMRYDGPGGGGQRFPYVCFLLADGTERRILCHREVWKVELPNGEVQASRSQVPLICAWALSIHKAQGQTLERVKVDLGKVFEKGQAYVALSRATTMEGLQVLRFDPKKVLAHDKVRHFYAGLSRAEQAGGLVNGGKGKQPKPRVENDDQRDGFENR